MDLSANIKVVREGENSSGSLPASVSSQLSLFYSSSLSTKHCL